MERLLQTILDREPRLAEGRKITKSVGNHIWLESFFLNGSAGLVTGIWRVASLVYQLSRIVWEHITDTGAIEKMAGAK
jgi:hypothetical protein